ncbi:MAG: leucine-rich repeat domain-containing protein [Spirochaetaceae bacterium]|jgi:hypothetical protein|nr:leucine-rich repeat domain-containing protein [Spirochaetaceae bacterium]
MLKHIAILFVILASFLTVSCPIVTWEKPEEYTYLADYYGNGNTSGAPPADPRVYKRGDTLIVLGKGSMERKDYEFSGWRRYENDIVYQEGDAIIVYYGNISFAAQWHYTGSLFDYTIDGGSAAVIRYIGPLGEPFALTIPAEIEDVPVTLLGEEAFMNCQILEVTFPAGIKTIGSQCFAQNYLSALTLPASLTDIGEGAFSNNELIGALRIPNSVSDIGAMAFQHNNLSGISFGPALASIGAYAFAYNSLTHLDMPSVAAVEAGAFFKNDIDMIRIGANVEIKSDSSFGTYGASFRGYYEANGKQAGTYTYDRAASAWTRS